MEKEKEKNIYEKPIIEYYVYKDSDIITLSQDIDQETGFGPIM